MKQKICLLRQKKDDVLSIIILEFFKLIGFVVRDAILDRRFRWDESMDKYDYYYVIDDALKKWESVCSEQIWQEKKVFYLKTDGNIQKTAYINLERIIRGLELEHDETNQLLKIKSQYEKTELFFYLYNKGNLKFVEEYYPVSDKGKDISIELERKKCMKNTFIQFQQCHDVLETFADELSDQCLSVYYKFALAKLMYKINEIADLLDIGHIYRTDYILSCLSDIMQERPEFIRAYYLYGHVCAADRQYLWEAQWYYEKAIAVLQRYYPDSREKEFLFYQMGRYYEKKRKYMSRANECYRKAYQCAPRAFRTLFKLAIAAWNEHRYGDTADLCNEIIRVVLNGYQMRELMPKQQIYIYKCYRLLGDAFSVEGHYDLAEKSYRKALMLINAGSDFFEEASALVNKNVCDGYANIILACMPSQPIYLNIIGCAARYGDKDVIEECYNYL